MIQRLARAIGAATTLVTVVGGVPVLLVLFGRSPLDGSGSLWDQLGRLPTQSVTDNMAFGLLTIAAWASWAVFSLHVVAEIAATLGGAVRWRIPANGLFQMSARRLVTALTMSASLSTPLIQRTTALPALATTVPELSVLGPRTSTAPTEPAGLLVEAVMVRDPVVADVPATVAVAPTPAMASQVEAPQAITVIAGDSPWMLAERHLGNGLRWRELWDLNRGVPQPDGRSWITEDLIRPGWQLDLPADAVNVPAPAAEPSPSEPTSREPNLPPADDEDAGLPASDAPSSTPWDPASTDRPSAPAAPEWSPPASVSTTTTAVPEADGLPHGPATSTDSPTSTSGETDTAAPPPTGADDDQREVDFNAEDDDDVELPVVPLLGTAGTLLAVSVVREWHRRSARRTTVLPVTASLPPTPHVSVGPELLARADVIAADRLDAALTHLAHDSRPRSGRECVQPRVVQVTDERIDVLLDHPDPGPPAPWRPEASGLIWVLDADQALPATDDDLSPMPALVTVGAGDAEILVDLEAYGVVALVGNDDACRDLARSMVTELSARNEGAVSVEIIDGVLDDESCRLDGVERYDGWDDVDTGSVQTSARLLDTGGWPHTWAARTSGRIYDGWAPTVWVTGHSDHERYIETVEAIAAHPGAGSAIVVVGGDPGCGLRIHVHSHGRFDIPELNLRGETQRLAPEVTAELADLLEAADALPGHDDMSLTTADVVAGPAVAWADDEEPAVAPSHDGPYEDPPFEVLVRVCGPIRIEGGRTKLPQRETAIATYVALNGEVDIEQVRDAVWAGAGVSLKRTRNVISEVRASVRDAVFFTPEHRLRAGTGLLTDLELIRRRLTYAESQTDPELKAEILAGALDWVTGRVCSYPKSAGRCWTWIDLDDWRTHLERIVGTTASQLARLYLDLGDPESACQAARRGIDAIGRRDELTILQVKAYEQLGDEPSARSTIQAHERYLNELGIEEFNEELLTLLDRYATPAHHKPMVRRSGTSA